MQKISSEEELKAILEKIFSKENSETILDRNTKALFSTMDAIEFTSREEEILKEIILGKSNQEIASMFDLGVSTVRFHRANIFEKAGVHSAAELTAWYLGVKGAI